MGLAPYGKDRYCAKVCEVVALRNGGFQLDATVDTGSRTIGFKLTNSSSGDMIRYGATTLQPNTWYYITGVYDAAAQTLHVYLNGQLDDGQLVGTVTATQQTSSLDVEIGQRPGNPGTFEFNGRIDEVHRNRIVAKYFFIQHPNAAARDRPHGELFMPRKAEFANKENIERKI